MQISHVIRGEEWLPSTPKHVLLYQAFDWEMPRFAHLPLLLNPDKSKMSKRFGDVFAKSFREKGFFPDALVNFVALLGWNPTADREIFTMTELIEHFSLDKVNKAGAVFDTKKLEWMNAQYLRASDGQTLLPELQRILHDHSIEISDERAKNILILLRERITFLNEIPSFGAYMFSESFEIDQEYKAKHWNEETSSIIHALLPVLKAAESFEHEQLNEIIGGYSKEHGIASKFIIHPLRMMLTGKQVGAGLYETMEVLGKETCINRIECFLQEQGNPS
jgi:glutamyl-tRNA synthetase